MSDPALTAGYAFILGGLGLIVGSFLNVVIYRVPRGLSIVRPGSACPACHAPIRARDNIPLVSWVLLRGRCRSCAAPISPRYPLVELLTAVVWLALGWWAWQPSGIDPLLPLLLVLGSAGVALTLIDIEHHRLPDAMVLPLYPVTIVGLALDGLLSGDLPVATCLLSAGAWVGVIGGLWLVTGGRGMGLGDVKLAPILGATLGWIGWGPSIVGIFAAFVLGGIVGLGLMIVRHAHGRTALPFGPFLIVGAGIGIFAGEAIAAAYLSAVGL